MLGGHEALSYFWSCVFLCPLKSQNSVICMPGLCHPYPLDKHLAILIAMTRRLCDLWVRACSSLSQRAAAWFLALTEHRAPAEVTESSLVTWWHLHETLSVPWSQDDWKTHFHSCWIFLSWNQAFRKIPLKNLIDKHKHFSSKIKGFRITLDNLKK